MEILIKRIEFLEYAKKATSEISGHGEKREISSETILQLAEAWIKCDGNQCFCRVLVDLPGEIPHGRFFRDTSFSNLLNCSSIQNTFMLAVKFKV